MDVPKDQDTGPVHYSTCNLLHTYAGTKLYLAMISTEFDQSDLGTSEKFTLTQFSIGTDNICHSHYAVNTKNWFFGVLY